MDIVEEKQKNLEKTWIIFRVIEAVVLIVFGVLNIVYFKNDGFTKIVFYVIGSLLAVDGVMTIIKYYISPVDTAAIVQEFIISIFEIALGVLFVVDAQKMLEALQDFLALFISVVLFSAAFVFGLGATIAIIHKKRKMWVAVVEYIITAMFIAGGILLLIYRSNAEQYIWYVIVILCGLIMIGMGVYALVTSFLPFRKKKPKKVKAEKADKKDKEPIDAVGSEKKEEPKSEIKDYNSQQIEEKKAEPADTSKPVIIDAEPQKKE